FEANNSYQERRTVRISDLKQEEPKAQGEKRFETAEKWLMRTGCRTACKKSKESSQHEHILNQVNRSLKAGKTPLAQSAFENQQHHRGKQRGSPAASRDRPDQQRWGGSEEAKFHDVCFSLWRRGPTKTALRHPPQGQAGNALW